MRIPKLAAECGLTEQYEDVKITSEGYVDGEWYAHQGVTIDAEACNELRAVFQMLGEQKLTVNDARAKAGLPAMVESDLPVLAEKRPEPPPPLVSRHLSMPELLAKIDAWVARQPSKEPQKCINVCDAAQAGEPCFPECAPEKRPDDVLFDFNMHIFDEMQKPTIFDKMRQAQTESATQPSEPQVRSRSAAAKSPLNGVLTEQSGRYCGLGYCDED
jgi:hypothetical protein